MSFFRETLSSADIPSFITALPPFLLLAARQVPKASKDAGGGGGSSSSSKPPAAEPPPPSAMSTSAASPGGHGARGGGGDVAMDGMGKVEQSSVLQKGCAVRVLYDDAGWFSGVIRSKCAGGNKYIVDFPDGSAEEVEYPDAEGGVEVCYNKDALSKKVKEWARGTLKAGIEYAVRKNKLIESVKVTALESTEAATVVYAKNIKGGAVEEVSLEGAAGRMLR